MAWKLKTSPKYVRRAVALCCPALSTADWYRKGHRRIPVSHGRHSGCVLPLASSKLQRAIVYITYGLFPIYPECGLKMSTQRMCTGLHLNFVNLNWNRIVLLTSMKNVIQELRKLFLLSDSSTRRNFTEAWTTPVHTEGRTMTLTALGSLELHRTFMKITENCQRAWPVLLLFQLKNCLTS